MKRTIGLLTTAAVDDTQGNAELVSVGARLELVLEDGSTLLLLDDRGWGTTQPWSSAMRDDIVATALMVVGPDEPVGGQTLGETVMAYLAVP